MKIFFYMGRNPSTKSDVSWKIWKLSRRGRTVTTHWGPAKLQGRKAVLRNTAQTETHKFKTLKEFVDFENWIIKAKRKKGYQRRTRWH